MNNLKQYINQDILNPKFLFHGSPYKLEKIEPMQSQDINNKENEDKAIFLTSHFISAVAYAFRNKIKELNNEWSFDINNNGKLPAMIFTAKNVPDELLGYVYVFNMQKDILKDSHKNTTQYRCYIELKTIDIIEVKYKDYEKYFKRTL